MPYQLSLGSIVLFSLALSACQETVSTQQSGALVKTNLAYAPYQSAGLVHFPPAPKVETPAVSSAIASVSIDRLSEISVPALTQKVRPSSGDASSQSPVQGETGALAAGPGGAPTSAPSSQPTSRPTAPTSQATAHPGSQPTSQDQQVLAGFVYGEISLNDAVKDKVKPGSVLFVIVRRYAPEGQKGMMIAATKLEGITKDKFPLRYVVKQSDAMMGAPLVGKVNVSVRIDQDGDAISKQAGDVVGEAKEAVMVGVNPVAVELDKTIE